MSEAERFEEVCREVLGRVTPTEEERDEVLCFSLRMAELLDRELDRRGVDGRVEVHGSVAKDTWLSGERDIDIFVVLPREAGEEGLRAVVDAAKELPLERWVEVYAEHPYLRGWVEGFTVEFVPCFEMEEGGEPISAADRTPLHTRFVNTHLRPEQRGDVRLLKRFMVGIGAYGAEMKVGGFSGYLCELLIIAYGSFRKLLEAASVWRRGELIDPAGHYGGRSWEAEAVFGEQPLIVVDPVDRRRNVASAVRDEKLAAFMTASRLMLRKPSVRFFYPPEPKPMTRREFEETLSKSGTDVLAVRTRVGEPTVPEVLWGQVLKTESALRRLLESRGFNVLRSTSWSDEAEEVAFIFELEAARLPAVERRVGPPVWMVVDTLRFVSKHVASDRTVRGPWIEGDRLMVALLREYRDAKRLLEDKLGGGGRDVGVGRIIAEWMKSRLEVLLNEEVWKLCEESDGFSKALSQFLKGVPPWMEGWNP